MLSVTETLKFVHHMSCMSYMLDNFVSPLFLFLFLALFKSNTNQTITCYLHHHHHHGWRRALSTPPLPISFPLLDPWCPAPLHLELDLILKPPSLLSSPTWRALSPLLDPRRAPLSIPPSRALSLPPIHIEAHRHFHRPSGVGLRLSALILLMRAELILNISKSIAISQYLNIINIRKNIRKMQ